MLACSVMESEHPCDANSCPSRSHLQKTKRRKTVKDSKCTTAVQPIDLVFLVDGSGSVKPQGFQSSKRFVKDVLEDLSLGDGLSEVRVAVLQFSDHAETGIDLADGISKDAIVAAVNGMPYRRGGTNTAAGLQFAVETFENARPTAAKMLVVIADGDSHPDPEAAADEARAQGIDVVAVGVGKGISSDELQKIAGPEGKVLNVDDYTQLSSIVSKTSKIACEATATPTPAPTVAPTPMPTYTPYRLVCMKNNLFWGHDTISFQLRWRHHGVPKMQGSGLLSHGKRGCIDMKILEQSGALKKFQTVNVEVHMQNSKIKMKKHGTITYDPVRNTYELECEGEGTGWLCYRKYR